jgi:hypothetical protein
MSLWGNLDAANNAPKQSAMTGYGGTTGSVSANGQTYYSNTQINATVQNNALGVFGVDTTEQTNSTSAQGVPQHAGWVVRKVGMGPITSVTANAGAVGVNATMTITGGNGIGATTGNTPGTVVVSVNATNHIVSVNVVNGGLYANTPVINAMSNAVFTITMGGRANRVQTETLVAMGSIYGDGGSVY